MPCYSLSHLSDNALLSGLSSLAARDRATTAELLAHLAEVDARRLYLPAACPSMLDYCIRKLHMSDDAAFKRIRVARAARDFPAIYEMVADGRLNLSAVILLKPHLRQDSAQELLSAAAHQTRSEIERLLAQRFPRPHRPNRVDGIPEQLAARPVEGPGADADTFQLAPGPVEALKPRAKVESLAPQRFALQVMIGQETYDTLRYAQALLSHSVPNGDLVEVIDRALLALVSQLEKRKFAASSRPRAGRKGSDDPRHIPADVRRRVCERDQGRCTFVSETGERCPASDLLEFDHVDPVARGGKATVEGIRLLCRAHNQFEAERVFGVGLMEERRQEARRAAKARAAAETRVAAETGACAEAREQAQDVLAVLRNLGVRGERARRIASLSETFPVATLEDRVRAALRLLGPKPRDFIASDPAGSAPIVTSGLN